MKGLFFGVLSASLLLFGCSQGTAPQGHYQTTSVVADGQVNDWPQPLRFTNPRHTYSFNVTNDAKNIYICVLTKDDRMQRRILKAGMDIFFDPKGKENHEIDLSYPESNSADGFISPDSTNSKHALVAAANIFNTSGFLQIENGQSNVGDKASPIKVAMVLHPDSTLVYEAIVPLYTVLKNGGLDSKTLRKDFSVGLVIGALPEPRANSRNNGGGSGGGGGFRPHMGMGMGGGGMGMGGGMHGSGSHSTNGQAQKPQNESAWYTFRFAQK